MSYPSCDGGAKALTTGDLAEDADGKYLQLPKASDQAIASIAMEAISTI